MSMVQFNRVWEINSIEDYNKAMEILDGNEFIAQMSDDYYNWNRELTEVRRQKAEVRKQAIEKGIL